MKEKNLPIQQKCQRRKSRILAERWGGVKESASNEDELETLVPDSSGDAKEELDPDFSVDAEEELDPDFSVDVEEELDLEEATPSDAIKEGSEKATPSIAKKQTGHTSYYVDAEEGDDDNDGSLESPWRTLEKVNSTEFFPGDKILLKAGCVWDGVLNPKGNGDENSPITIDQYGEGPRPMINGCGTEGPSITGAVLLYNQEYWEIYNLEVTNLEPTDEEGGRMDSGSAERAGILIYSSNQKEIYKHIVIKNCYVHDVNSDWNGGKTSGGIIVMGHYMDMEGNIVTIDENGNPTPHAMGRAAFTDVLIEGNYVKNVAIEGIRNKCNTNITSSGWGKNEFLKNFSDVTIRNNYLEDVVGDGIVLTECVGGLIEGNIVNNSCGEDRGKVNYAQCWTMFADDVLVQYNEVYGNKYGYDDGEAFDSDMRNERNIFQYNLSHDNGGGACLFMSSQKDTVFRYNVSVNDGSGTYPNGEKMRQQIFHYDNTSSDGPAVPEIYNNTFYVGNGEDTVLFGGKDKRTCFINFKNNIVMAENDSEITFTHNDSNIHGDSIIENNVFWPENIGNTNGFTKEKLEEKGNIFADPMLQNPGAANGGKENTDYTGYVFALEDLEDMIDSNWTKERVIEMSKPWQLQEGSPCIKAGQMIEGAPDTDLWENTIVGRTDIGAHEFSNEDETAKSIASVSLVTSPGIAPKLPQTVMVTFDDNSTTPYKVNWDSILPAHYEKPGKFIVEGSLRGIVGKAEALVVVSDTPLRYEEITVETNAGVYPDLPETITAWFEDDLTAELSVKWETLTLEQYSKEGIIAVTGKAEGMKDNCKLYVEVMGNIGDGKTLEELGVAQDAYIQKAGTNLDKKVIKVKNANAADYNRRSLVKFDLGSKKDIIDQATYITFKAYVTRYDKEGNVGLKDPERDTERLLRVYEVANDWDENTITWGNAPTLSEEKIVVNDVRFVNREIKDHGDIIEIDMTNYIKKAAKSGQSEISLLFGVFDNTPYQSGDNSGFDMASKENGEHPGPVLEISNIYMESIEEPEVSVPAGVEPRLPKTVTVTYSDGTEKEEAVIWDTMNPEDYQTEGTRFTVSGKIASSHYPVTCMITVIEAPHVITAVQDIPQIIKLQGTELEELGLPMRVMVTLDDGSEERIDIKDHYWFPDVPYDPTRVQDYSFKGYLDLTEIASIVNPDDLEASVQVSIIKAEDRGELLDLYAKAVEYVLDGKIDQLIPSVRETFTAAVEEAIKTLKDETATKENIHEVFGRLAQAVEEAQKSENQKADISSLEKWVIIAGTVNEEEYTQESYQILEQALAEAKTLLKREDISQSMQQEVDKLAQNLEESIRQLVKREEKPETVAAGIRIKALPNRVQYKVGQSFDPEGLKVVLAYNDGTEQALEHYQLSPVSTSTPGTKTVTVTCYAITDNGLKEMRATFEITVTAYSDNDSESKEDSSNADHSDSTVSTQSAQSLQNAYPSLVGTIPSSTREGSWERTEPGRWILRKKDGSQAVNEWAQIDNCWYLFDQKGSMLQGWAQVNNTWYYLNPTSGAMMTGWQCINGKWYYLDPINGDMKNGVIPINGVLYQLGNDGSWVS